MYNGYYLKVQGLIMNNPAPLREGFKVYPRLIQTADSGRVASGKLVLKVLEHTPAKVEVEFPVMTPEQFRAYYTAINSSMFLSVEFYDQANDNYTTRTMYHSDIIYTPVKWGGQEMIKMDKISFIEH